MISEGAMIHSAPKLSARAPTIGPVTKVGADEATTIVSDPNSERPIELEAYDKSSPQIPSFYPIQTGHEGSS